jgi:phage gp29-like protein
MSTLSAGLISQIKRSRFNPIRNLTPDTLASQLESFAAGYLRDFALTAQAIERRDDVICVALPKRKKAPARRGFTVQLLDGLDDTRAARAQVHQEALQYFYNNLRVTDALEGDVQGGFKLLVRQMMGAVGLRYAVHEITWRPVVVANRDQLTATLTHVPIQFFESNTGRLRFLKNYLGQLDGEDMDPLAWLVTVGEGVLEPLAIAYMFKQLSLKDWVSYNEKFGTPGLLGKTNSAKNSDGWQVLESAIAAFSSDWSALVNEGSSIELIEAKGAGTLPFPALVERMDRAIATICRGADLSTMSAGGGSGQGASLQGDEGDLLEADDAEMITETLQRLDRIIIDQLFGEEPLAYVQIQVPKRKDSADMRANLTFLRDSGVRVGVEYAREQFGVPAPKGDEPALAVPAQPAATGFGGAPRAFANAGADAKAVLFKSDALRSLKSAQLAALRPLITRIVAVTDLPEAQFDAGVKALRTDLPNLAKTALSADATGELAKAFESILGTALVSGAAEAAQAKA